ncbi:BspA family leucine-rich repeat surface protein, partial [Lactobacillus mellis]|uniref:BspA family leucine-rich repeat surface protein n=1 Tax=Bombilactobacillus mellis TaxID=1218508 RepID=UPI0015812A4D
GDDYILHLHAGTLGTPGEDHGLYETWDAGIGSLNTAFKSQLTQIIIDPGVIANQNSRGLFSHLGKLKTIQGLENLDTSQVTNMSRMFAFCENLTSLDVSHFNTSKVTDMDMMFDFCKNLTNLDVSHFNTSKVTDMDMMFDFCENLTNLDVSQWDTSQVTDMSDMFDLCHNLTNLDVSHFDTSQVTNMSEMFEECETLTSLDVSHFDTSQVTNMDMMFYECQNLTSLDVSHFDTSQVTDMSGMFMSCWNLTSLDVSHFDTSQVTDISGMFNTCKSLTSLDVSHFDTSQVTNMAAMFYWSSSLANLDVSHFDTSQVTNMHSMFGGCSSLTSLDLSHFDTSRVIYMSKMFSGCKNLTSLDLSSFDTSQVTNEYPYNDKFVMLEDCTNLHHLVLGPKTKLIDPNGSNSALPAVPAAGTKIPGTDKVVTAPYWVATSGYQQGKRYTSDELEQLTGRDQVTTYDWDSQVHYQETIESKLVTRTINVHYPDGQMKIFQDTVHLSRKIKVKADGSKVYGDWSQDQWKSYDAPQIAGYQANQSNIPAQTVDSNTTDTTIDILYEPLAQTIVIQYLDQGQVVGTQKLVGYTGETLIPNYHAPQGYEITSSPQPNITVDATGKQIIQVNVSHKFTQSSETLTKTRTIIIHFPNSTTKTYQQVAFVKRMVAVDQVTGSKNYGSWHNDSWDAMEIPIIEGYTANQNSIAAQDVTAETENETIDIFYVQK